MSTLIRWIAAPVPASRRGRLAQALVQAALVLSLPALAVAASPADLAATTIQVRDRALKDETALKVAESLTTEVGARPVGTPAMDHAKDWGVAKLKELGFSNIHVETFSTRVWTRRGVDRAEIVGTYPRALQVLALGGSAATPAGGLTAPIALFKTYQELLEQPPGSLTGKIAVVTQPMARTQDMTGYGSAYVWRGAGPGDAAKRGAVAYLLRSLSMSSTRLPHTGTSTPAGIPAAALSVPDAELLERLVAGGHPVVVKLVLDSTTQPASVAYNISGEIPGATDELVVVGGHLDSWDPGTGAVDDAAGIAISMAAAKLATETGGRPRKTIRMVMWGSEEQSGSGAAYAAAHKAEIPRMAVAVESDSGADRVYSAALPAGGLKLAPMQAFFGAVAPLGVAVLPTPAKDGGSDVEALAAGGVPVLELAQDVSRYFELHHSADDTFDKIDPRQLAQNVAVLAAFLHVVAYSDVSFRAAPAAQ